MKRKYQNNYFKPNLETRNKRPIFKKPRVSLFGRIKLFFRGFLNLFLFILVVAVYVFHQISNWLLGGRFSPLFLKNKLKPNVDKVYEKIMGVIDPELPKSFNRSYLIELSLNNMKVKKTRTMVTMGGMAIGIAFIVFLVSLGYGLQNLVVSRVARLDELKQADAVPGLTEGLALNDETLTKFGDIPNVEVTLPVIAVVGKVSYQNSVSDMAVYGVTTDYLKNSAIQPVRGKIFEDGNMVSVKLEGEVAGIIKEDEIFEMGDELGEVDYEIGPTAWLRVREEASPQAKLLGYTRRIEGSQSGEEVIGETYLDNEGKVVNKWIKTNVLLWQKTSCDENSEATCEEGNYLPIINEEEGQEQREGYVAELSMKVSSIKVLETKVLGLTSENNNTGSLPIVNIASESATKEQPQNKIIEISDQAKRVAVVNRSVLQVLNMTENEAVGKKVSLSFVVVGDLMTEQTEKVESAKTDYTIVGVIPDSGTPMVYVPFIDLRSLGITKFSQVKLIVNNTDSLAKVRATVEASGYGTISVVDTVAQIDKLFVSFRLVLAVLGMVALVVAALGMFNTLTVSLMERTREVGLMKAMGMKSNEVKELFLTESMIMGFFGGIIGLVGGALIGKILSLVLTAFSLVRGVGTVDISFVPPVFIVMVLLLSVIVGILTGYFPARRATKISALNALRYE
jgi:ABC-type antimicrobial peptide transport system permease subunit